MAIPAAVAPETPSTATPTRSPAPAPTATTTATAARVDVAEGDAGPRAMLRVRADTIDRLVNEAGEVAIARARIDGELRALKSNLLELTGSVIRLRGQVREIEIQAESQIQSRMTQMHEHSDDFDPLEFDRYTRFQELTRSLAEGVNDVSTVQQALLKNLDDADAALLAQSRLSRDMQQQLFAIRTVPFSSLSERLYRIVRQVAKELGKRVNLEIVGAQTELDRSVLEKLAGPLEHLLRNALDHGIEGRDARRAVGKSETGEITLSVRQSGNEIVIELVDDGAGIDLGRVREKALALGLVPGDATPTDRQLLDCIFRPGFSTATRVTAISGRGVGMDVVRAELAALGGRVEVETESGRGSRFTLALPLTLAVAQAVLVRAGGRMWALPAPMVEQVQQVREEALFNLYVTREVEWQGRRYPFHYLPRLRRRHRPPSRNAALQLRAAAEERARRLRDPHRRDGGQAGNRGEEHRPAARARLRHRRRDGARHRRDRADHQPGAARGTPRRPGARSQRRDARGRQGGGDAGPAAGDDRRRLAHGAQDHEPPAGRARASASPPRRTGSTRCRRSPTRRPT